MSTMPIGAIRGVDKPVSQLVQGTMLFDTLDGEKAIFELLDGVRELGCTAFDTAHVYGGGENERLFGNWLASRDDRDEIVVIGKGCEPSDDRSRLTPDDLTSDLHDSLARMRLDHIDLYLVHVDDPTVDVDPIVEALAAHREAGKIASYGVSNWCQDRIHLADEHAKRIGAPEIAASSVNLSLAVQAELPWRGNVSISDDVAEQESYRTSGLPLLTWSSLAGGFFSGRFTRETVKTASGYFDEVTARTYGTEANFQRLRRAQDFGHERGYSAAQVALAWVAAQPMNVFPLVGCSTPREFQENRDAVEFARSLTGEQLRWLRDGNS